MNTIIKQQIIIVLSFLIVFQSCAIRYRNLFPEALNKAYVKDRAIEIKTLRGEYLKYQHIVVNRDSFYGLKKNNQLPDTIPINISNIKELKLKNRTVLNTLEFMGMIILLTAIIVVWVDSGFDFEYED